jgi:uncharacterized protein YacL
MTQERRFLTTPRFITQFAEEVAKQIIARLPQLPVRKKKTVRKPKSELIGAVILDTSAIMDGRIVALSSLGVIRGHLVVLESVLQEMKRIADGTDALRKMRAKRGLDGLSQIKKSPTIKFHLIPSKKTDSLKLPVDEQLIVFSKETKGVLYTCDFNLEKKASLQGVSAINLHAVADAMKVMALPGETVALTLVHAGKESTQGVGYLEDGTMIVVEQAADKVGSDVQVTLSRVLQTHSGKIFFGKLTNPAE